MPIDLPKPTELAVPLFIVLMLIELIYGWRTGKARFEAKDTLTSLIMGTGSTIAGALSATFTFAFVYWVWDSFRLFDWGYAWWVFVVAFVLDDLAYYWIHRMGHRMRWMWAAHVIHHSSQHYNLSTALRQTWTGSLTPGILFKLPIFILGIDPLIVAFVAGLNLIYQFWIHTEAIDKCPRWFEYLFNTPSHHRVHHSNNPQYLDANYAGVLMVWDRVFGSFVPEDKAEPCRYGLVSDLGTFNPLRVAVHEWVGIFKDMWAAKGIKNKIMFLIAPPGWTPDGSRLTSEMIKERAKRLEMSKADQVAAE
ncbi:sterol desaturase family protein [Kordiimonas sp. SCSIO 12610]|uniref:sterol desaturase family protein n=1 Tax=Kordiimonas sp. SCSIO 12610 TaxID=2829597 RepID=UPI00210ABFB8|nr:sterol desaturase family protein [Kordiimonas sp. SCSIO 12610]UTW53827.1 sterol desaturase family protein [Kordiimonas sp. SCSIO 12610]